MDTSDVTDIEDYNKSATNSDAMSDADTEPITENVTNTQQLTITPLNITAINDEYYRRIYETNQIANTEYSLSPSETPPSPSPLVRSNAFYTSPPE
jgi:hypothetical protein